jgi:hypothetical protein
MNMSCGNERKERTSRGFTSSRYGRNNDVIQLLRKDEGWPSTPTIINFLMVLDGTSSRTKMITLRQDPKESLLE